MIDEDVRPRASATIKFYTVFLLALAVVVLAAYFVGYRTGVAHAGRTGSNTHQAP